MMLWWALLLASTGWIVLGLGAIIFTTRRRAAVDRQPLGLPPITVLKPVCGLDASLRENLASFFALDYPDYQLLFGVEDRDDPAIAIIEQLQRRHPDIDSLLVIHGRCRGGLNPKVRNLRQMLPHARHDLLLISDSNVRARPSYLRELAGTMLAGDVPAGLVTNLFAGAGENTLGSALENVQLCGFCAAGAALPTVIGDAAVIGKSMLLSRAVFERLGGFERVAGVLAEDFVIGKLFQHAGYAIRLAPTVLDNVTGGMTLRSFFRRHQRWAMLRWRLRPAAFLLEPLTSPLGMLPVAIAALGPYGFAWTAALSVLRDVGGWVLLRGSGRAWIPLLLSPLREIIVLAAWLGAPFKRHVSWRGQRVRLGAGTLLFATDQSADVNR